MPRLAVLDGPRARPLVIGHCNLSHRHPQWGTRAFLSSSVLAPAYLLRSGVAHLGPYHTCSLLLHDHWNTETLETLQTSTVTAMMVVTLFHVPEDQFVHQTTD